MNDDPVYYYVALLIMFLLGTVMVAGGWWAATLLSPVGFLSMLGIVWAILVGVAGMFVMLISMLAAFDA